MFTMSIFGTHCKDARVQGKGSKGCRAQGKRPRGQGERDQWPRERERKRRVVPSRGECCVSKMWVCNVQISDWTGGSGAP